VVYATEPFRMGEKLICGKSMDDRACFVILCRVMELLKDEPIPVNLCVLGSVQEEYTAVGAAVGAFSMMPERAIVVDVSFARTPDSDADETVPLGSGPMIGVGPVQNRTMSRKLMALAKELEIPFTREVMSSYTGTNADEIQISRQGVAVCNVSLPLRYMHTPIEAVHLDDVENCAKLIAAYIRSLKEVAPC
jgi:endoglucanase